MTTTSPASRPAAAEGSCIFVRHAHSCRNEPLRSAPRSHASIRGANRSSDLVRHSPSAAEQCRADWSGDTAPTDKLSTVAVRGSSPVGAAKRFDRGPQDQDQPTCRRHVVKMSSCRTCRLLSRRHIHDMSSMSSRHGRHVFLTCRMSCLLGGPADMSSDDIANIERRIAEKLQLLRYTLGLSALSC